MSSRLRFYHRQRVTDAELNLAFEQLEEADRNFVGDLGIHGIVAGAVPVPQSPVSDLSIELTAPGRAYDRAGRRVFFASPQRVDLASDSAGIPTDVVAAGNERWVGVFLRFARVLSDPRIDGNSQQVMFRQDESFEIVVRQSPEGPAGAAMRVPYVDDELLACEVRRVAGQTRIAAANIDTTRRQAFIFSQGVAVAISSALWDVLHPPVDTVQSAFDETDAALDGHVEGTRLRHRAEQVDYVPHGFLTEADSQRALDQLVDELVSDRGATHVGSAELPGTPHALVAGTVREQLVGLLDRQNAHVTGGDHDDRYYTRAESDARYYRDGQPVGDADTLDGRHANEFALAGHVHDDRYLRRVYGYSNVLPAREARDLVVLRDRPDHIAVSYNELDQSGWPQDRVWVIGPHHVLLRVWLTKIHNALLDKDYRLTIQNLAAVPLWINVTAFQIGAAPIRIGGPRVPPAPRDPNVS